jgi:predicted SnoaL-like aldol condensation-catalyzing enzyme
MYSEREIANLATVKRVYTEVLDRAASGAVDALFHPDYIQHNPDAATGSQGLKDLMDDAKNRYSAINHRIKRMFADGDHVIAHVHLVFEPGTKEFAVMDIFRIENGKVAEHWDVLQPVATSSANANSMF